MRTYLLLLCLLSALTSWSQNLTIQDGILYLIENDQATIGRQDKNLAGDIVIPASIEYDGDTYPVTGIVAPTNETGYSDNTFTCEGGAFQECKIKSIVLPSTIQAIPVGTFHTCEYLTKVSLPESISQVGAGAFANCTRLEEINLSDAIPQIEFYAFGNCSALTSIALPENLISLENGAFKNSGLIEIDLPESVIYMAPESLNTPTLRNVTVHYRDLQSVSCSPIAFPRELNCTLTIPFGTSSIYSVEEPWCDFPEVIEVGEGEVIESNKILCTIDDIRYMLYKDTKTACIWRQQNTLEGDIEIPQTLEYENIEYVVDSLVEPITMTLFSNGSVITERGAFQGCAISSIKLPDSIHVIPAGAFQNCPNLSEVSLPGALEVIEVGAFAYCDNLETIDLPDSITDLGSASFGYGYHSFVFGNCGKLKKVILPANLSKISGGCFKNSGLEELHIKKNTTVLEPYALDCYYLTDLYIDIQDPMTIETTESSFGDMNECTLYVPAGSKDLYQEFYPWISFKAIEETEDEQDPFTPGYTIVHKDAVRYILYPDNTALVARQNKDLSGEIFLRAKIVLDSDIYTVVGFVEPTELTAWSDNVITTEGGAFQDCDITGIYIPEGISVIPAGTFSNCTFLSEVELPESLTDIGAAAFSNCHALEEIFIPENVVNLGCGSNYGFVSYVFGGCSSLKKVNIPSGVTSISQGCFKNSGLTSFLITAQLDRLEPDCFTLPELEYVKLEHKDLTNLEYTESIFPETISNVILLVPEGSKEYYSNFYPWRDFMEILEFNDMEDEHHYNAYGITTEIVVEESEIPTEEVEEPENNQRAYVRTRAENPYAEKSYLPSGLALTDYEVPEIEGLKFIGWEEMPEHMPSSDIVLRAIFKKDIETGNMSTFDSSTGISFIMTIDGYSINPRESLASLPTGLYVVTYNDGKSIKLRVK